MRIDAGAVQAGALDEFLSSNAQDFIEESKNPMTW